LLQLQNNEKVVVFKTILHIEVNQWTAIWTGGTLQQFVFLYLCGLVLFLIPGKKCEKPFNLSCHSIDPFKVISAILPGVQTLGPSAPSRHFPIVIIQIAAKNQFQLLPFFIANEWELLDLTISDDSPCYIGYMDRISFKSVVCKSQNSTLLSEVFDMSVKVLYSVHFGILM
jgi:hypothetical protein